MPDNAALSTADESLSMPDDTSTNILLRETISILRDTTKTSSELVSEIRADREERKLERDESIKVRAAMERVIAIGEDRIRMADLRRNREDVTEEIRLRTESEQNQNRWTAIRSVGRESWGVAKIPVYTLLIAGAGFIAATYFNSSESRASQPEPANVVIQNTQE